MVRLGADGRLAYGTDDAGNRVIDFSHADYAGAAQPIPLVPVKIVVEPAGRDDRVRIQAAIDLVAALPAGADGFRGAVLLQPGRFLIEGTLRLGVSGVVLRGSGERESGSNEGVRPWCLLFIPGISLPSSGGLNSNFALAMCDGQAWHPRRRCRIRLA